MRKERETRSINRTSIKKDDLINTLTDHTSNVYKVSSGLIDLLRLRINEKSFHPNAGQKILFISKKVFIILRISIDKKEQILAITNVTNKIQNIDIDLKKYKLPVKNWYNLFTKKSVPVIKSILTAHLKPYDYLWFKSSQ